MACYDKVSEGLTKPRQVLTFRRPIYIDWVTMLCTCSTCTPSHRDNSCFSMSFARITSTFPLVCRMIQPMTLFITFSFPACIAAISDGSASIARMQTSRRGSSWEDELESSSTEDSTSIFSANCLTGISDGEMSMCLRRSFADGRVICFVVMRSNKSPICATGIYSVLKGFPRAKSCPRKFWIILANHIIVNPT